MILPPLKDIPQNLACRVRAAGDEDGIRRLFLADKCVTAFECELAEALIRSNHPGFLLLESDDRIVAGGIIAPDFTEATAEVIAYAVESGAAYADLFACLLLCMIAALPADVDEHAISVSGYEESAQFFNELGFEDFGPNDPDAGSTSDGRSFGMHIGIRELNQVRAHLAGLGVIVPSGIFTCGENA